MTHGFKRLGLLLAILSLSLSCAVAQAQASRQYQKVRFSLNPAQIIYLPLFLAVERGYFRAEGLDVQVMPYKGSANSQMPLLARGDVDISAVIAGPAMFNQFSEGFNIKLISTLTEPKQGYRDGAVLVVRKDLWDAAAIRKLQDLKGRKVDGAVEGNPVDFLLRSALYSADLKKSDVTLSYKPRTPGDTPEILRQKVVDVAGVSEPTATLIESRGIGVRWLSYKDVVPWYQESYLASSEAFLRDHPAAVSSFLTAYLKAVREVAKARGQWTPELLALAAKWTGLPEDLLRSVGGIPYWNEKAGIRLESLARVQRFWVESGLVKKPIDPAKVVDMTQLERARQAAGAH
ncbi:ABC transporter substrate-binding protein [Cupriavidus sp. amp6]|uniref:ABC transporter substrate-binding protein n=1 Tax=Cupriavidus sp. amp6 TaxID=388051 RepID=UPI00042281DC|nr:ABC transporter substrate-binding protein [Cupriavidus sp. amp6]